MKRMGILLACILFTACHTVPTVVDSKADELAIDVQTKQTEIAISGKDVETTISDIKAITDDAKATGEIPKEKVITLIKYVDTASSKIEAHNKLIESMIPLTRQFMKARIADNKNHAEIIASLSAKVDKLKDQVSRRGTVIIYLSIALALFIISGILVVIAKLKKII